MAVIKHIASKNADYGESERYLIFQHNEYTQKPILDDEGHMILRDEYYLDGLNCDPFTFASECQELNSLSKIWSVTVCPTAICIPVSSNQTEYSFPSI